MTDNGSGFHIDVRVYHEDTDAGGIVYYANYLRFMERARTEFLRNAGFEQDVLMSLQRRMFVVTAVNIEYRLPARFNDLLAVSATLGSVRRASLEFGQTVTRQAVETVGSRVTTDRETICQATVALACLDSQSLRPARIPDDLLQVFAQSS